MAPVGAPRRVLKPPNRVGSLAQPLVGRPKATAVKVKKACCSNPQVDKEKYGDRICRTCFTDYDESNIVSEVQFSEDSRGAASVQGAYVGEGARHARTLGSASFRRIGGGEKNSFQEIEANGRRELAALCPRLSIPQNVLDQAISIWSLAAKANFTSGRRTDEVIGACLYAACRRQTANAVILTDISEQQKIGVFRLGEVYKDLCKTCYLEADTHIGVHNLVEPEPLILKYCNNLEFGASTKLVAEDALKILQRMKRDWMTPGRHPAGLCGAAIILAARMNNFRRTVREVVYVAKIADATIAKRVEEFRRTKSAALTVDQFRTFGARLKEQADPPSLLNDEREKQKLENRKRKRQEHHAMRESTIGTGSVSSTPDAEEAQPDPKRAKPNESPQQDQGERIDADGFAIPALPAHPELRHLKHLTAKRTGKPKKDLNKPAPIVDISEEELEIEKELEQEIDQMMDDRQLLDTRDEMQEAKLAERTRQLSEQQKLLDNDKIKARRTAQGITWFNSASAEDDELDLEALFVDDPEVENCLLSEEEIRNKELIWVTYNEDWLRRQHEKELLSKINESSGRKEHKRNKAKKKRARMGDGTLLAEADTPIETPADANAAMLAKHASKGFSKYVNYDALSAVYGERGRSASIAPSQATSRASSPRATAPSSRAASEAPPGPLRSATGLQTPRSTAQSASRFNAATAVQHPAEDDQEDEIDPSDDETNNDIGEDHPYRVYDRDDYGDDDGDEYGRAEEYINDSDYGGEYE